MAEHEQVNVRIPRSAKAVLKRIAERLREDEGFALHLGRLLDDIADPDLAPLLVRRVERLERQVAELVGGRPADPQSAALDTTADQASPPPRWTTGEGRGRRLTEDGDAELLRMLAAGKTDAQIARRLGIRAFAVAAKRRRFSPTAE